MVSPFKINATALPSLRIVARDHCDGAVFGYFLVLNRMTKSYFYSMQVPATFWNRKILVEIQGSTSTESLVGR